MRPIFRGFCINRFGIGPLHYISSRSDFGFEFTEIFVIEKLLSDSASRPIFRGFCINRFGIGPLHYISSRSDFGFEFTEICIRNRKTTFRLGESGSHATLQFGESGSRRLSDSAGLKKRCENRNAIPINQNWLNNDLNRK
jgi:hypothetical protein